MKERNNFHFLLLMLILSIGLNSCSNSQVKSKDDQVIVDLDLDVIRERGVLKALVDNSSTSYFIYKGQLMGYEYELLFLLAEEIGVSLEIILTPSIDEAFKKLNNGEGDIIAFALTVTKERKQHVAFTNSHYTTRQVLVQKKPKNWRKMKLHEIDAKLIRNQVELIGKKIHVRKSSSYAERLHNLSEEIGGDIIIIEDEKDVETEFMIRKVNNEVIQYTIADEDIALVNASYYPDIDIYTPISFPQQIAWAVRKNASELLSYINKWEASLKRTPTYNIIYGKYFKNPRASKKRLHSGFLSLNNGKISPYDDLIKAAADSIDWDWKLFAAQIYQESTFNPEAESWAGAIGLMQLIPETGKRFGADNLLNPAENIKAGTKYMEYLNGLWKKTISDDYERMKFVLASYNVGLGHIIDARELAKKYGASPTKWDGNVAVYLLRKTKPKYFKDKVVKFGYCRGEEPVNYVQNVLLRYDQYKQLIKE